jgi:hypothetical protein
MDDDEREFWPLEVTSLERRTKESWQQFAFFEAAHHTGVRSFAVKKVEKSGVSSNAIKLGINLLLLKELC